MYYTVAILSSKEKLIKHSSVFNKFSTLVKYNKRFQFVPSLVIKVSGICVFLSELSFDACIFQRERERGELMLLHTQLMLCFAPTLTFCQIFQGVIQ